MNCRSGIAAAMAALALLAFPACGDPVAGQVKKIKQEKTPDGLARLLVNLGYPKQELDSLGRGEAQGENIIAPKYLKRAETFPVELDGKEGKESVTQVFFEGKEEDGEKRRLYLVFVHKGDAPQTHAGFDLSYCGQMEKGGMTFAFKPVAGAARSQILFSVTRIESCGMETAGSDETDTLRLDQGAWVFKAGPASSYGRDRGDFPDE